MPTNRGDPAEILAKIRGIAAAAAVTINATAGLICSDRTGKYPL
jgi:hypothetical protein